LREDYEITLAIKCNAEHIAFEACGPEFWDWVDGGGVTPHPLNIVPRFT